MLAEVVTRQKPYSHTYMTPVQVSAQSLPYGVFL